MRNWFPRDPAGVSRAGVRHNTVSPVRFLRGPTAPSVKPTEFYANFHHGIKNPTFGFNAESEEFGDLVKAGVIDPAKVTRFARQNAGSIAALMLTTEAPVADLPEKEHAPAGPPHGGMGGGDF